MPSLMQVRHWPEFSNNGEGTFGTGICHKFISYLVGAEVIVHMDHAVPKYLLTKKDAKPQLIRWILLL